MKTKKQVMNDLSYCTLLGVCLVSVNATAANCGHDVHGAPRIEETKLGPNNSIVTYFSPATLIMDNPSDPRHRAFGECRGQGVVTNGVGVWQGGCIWKSSDADVLWVTWSAKPGDTGAENRDGMKGSAVVHGTGKMKSLDGKTNKWTGLANGGSYFCDD
jgi:hypothetical protein